MSNVFDLDSIREALENEFAPAVFKKGDAEYTLRNLLRVGKKDRTAIIRLMNELKDVQGEDENDDVEDPEKIERMQDLIGDLLRLVAKPGQGDALVDEIGDDLQMLSKVMEYWQEATGAGEAEDSPS